MGKIVTLVDFMQIT